MSIDLVTQPTEETKLDVSYRIVPENRGPAWERCSVVIDSGSCSGTCLGESHDVSKDRIALIPHPTIADLASFKNARGIVCEAATPFSHFGVICSIKGMTVVCCAPGAIENLEGREVLLSPQENRIYVDPPEDWIGVSDEIQPTPPLASTDDYTVSIFDPEDLVRVNSQALSMPPGYSLLRGEFIWLGRERELIEDCRLGNVKRLARTIRERIEECCSHLHAGQTLVYRNCDLRPDEYGVTPDSGSNPHLGTHGI
ncbi:MAG: hypothetical protein ACYTA5_20990, partial [Planctomycetota bacterium]